MNQRAAILGKCFGAIVDERFTDGRPAVTICVEDDGNWFEKMSFDAHWLDEIITVLEAAREVAAFGKAGR